MEAVRDVSFSAGDGEFLALLGANGAGKTTTMECVLGTAAKDGGRATIFGMDPLRQRKRVFERVGVQFQHGAFQDKIRVSEACRTHSSLFANPAPWEALLERLGIADKKCSAVSSLSGGERQKLMIAIALIPDPEVLFLDELTTGLDPRSRRTVWDFLLEYKKAGKTAVITSHFMDEVEYLCDRVLILRKGCLVEEGSASELIGRYKVRNLEDVFLASEEAT